MQIIDNNHDQPLAAADGISKNGAEIGKRAVIFDNIGFGGYEWFVFPALNPACPEDLNFGGHALLLMFSNFVPDCDCFAGSRRFLIKMSRFVCVRDFAAVFCIVSYFSFARSFRSWLSSAVSPPLGAKTATLARRPQTEKSCRRALLLNLRLTRTG
ncbi:MAG: hypothetical protein WCV63_00120 [Negativicutes bacterium]